MIIRRVWAMPNKWTFTIKPIKELLAKYVRYGLWVDPYCGNNSPANMLNDLDTTNKFAQSNLDALEYLKTLETAIYDGILLDPPYSLRQVSEHYKKAGIKITGWHTSAGYNAALKNESMRILKPGGFAICFGWNSMGLGKNRGCKMLEVLMVPHGGSKNDTIVTVEQKISNGAKSP